MIPVAYIYGTYALTFLFYFVFWMLVLKKIRKNALNIFEAIFKFIFQIPFWALFLYFNVQLLFPKIEEMIHPPRRMQKLIIENNTREVQNYTVYLQDSLLNWYPAFPLRNAKFTNRFSIDEKKSAVFYYQADSLKPFNKIYIRWLKQDKRLSPRLYYAKAFMIPSKAIKLYSTDFADLKLDTIEVDYSREWNLVALYFISLIGIWYLAILPNDKFWRIFMYSFAGIFSAYILMNLYFLIQAISEYYFLPHLPFIG